MLPCCYLVLFNLIGAAKIKSSHGKIFNKYAINEKRLNFFETFCHVTELQSLFINFQSHGCTLPLPPIFIYLFQVIMSLVFKCTSISLIDYLKLLISCYLY